MNTSNVLKVIGSTDVIYDTKFMYKLRVCIHWFLLVVTVPINGVIVFEVPPKNHGLHCWLHEHEGEQAVHYKILP